jgi:hypothetical protein
MVKVDSGQGSRTGDGKGWITGPDRKGGQQER